MEQHYHIAAVLPRSLEKLILALHGVRILSGVLLFFFGLGSVIYYKSMISFFVLSLGLTAILSGTTGLLAILYKSLAAHGGCVGTSAVTLYLGLKSYSTAIAVSTSLPAWNETVAMLMCDVLLISFDLVVSALSVGFEAVALYISTKNST